MKFLKKTRFESGGFFISKWAIAYVSCFKRNFTEMLQSIGMSENVTQVSAKTLSLRRMFTYCQNMTFEDIAKNIYSSAEKICSGAKNITTARRLVTRAE